MPLLPSYRVNPPLASRIQLSQCPLSSRVWYAIKEVVKFIQMEEYQYTDPVMSSLKELYIEFDFEAAQRD